MNKIADINSTCSDYFHKLRVIRQTPGKKFLQYQEIKNKFKTAMHDYSFDIWRRQRY